MLKVLEVGGKRLEEPLEQAGERGSLGLGQRGEQVPENRLTPVEGEPCVPPTNGCELDRGDPAVRGLGATHEPVRFQAVDQPHPAGVREADSPAQPVDRDAGKGEERRQRGRGCGAVAGRLRGRHTLRIRGDERERAREVQYGHERVLAFVRPGGPRFRLVSTPGKGPLGVTPGPDGRIWVTLADASELLAFQPAGPATTYTSASFANPHTISFDPAGRLWTTQYSDQILGFDVDAFAAAGSVTPSTVIRNP